MSENPTSRQKGPKDEDDSDFEEEMRITEAVEGVEINALPKTMKPVPEDEIQKLKESGKKPTGPNYPGLSGNPQSPTDDTNSREKETS